MSDKRSKEERQQAEVEAFRHNYGLDKKPRTPKHILKARELAQDAVGLSKLGKHERAGAALHSAVVVHSVGERKRARLKKNQKESQSNE